MRSLISTLHLISLGVIKLRRMGWAGHVTRLVEMRNSYKILVGKVQGKSTMRRPRRKWEENIEMDYRARRREGMEWLNRLKIESSGRLL
jgi:hypothetical protein